MLEELAKNVIPKTRVVRDGKAMMISSDKIVPGDIMLFSAGDTVPCDARIISSAGLFVSEDRITDNHGPVEKSSAVLPSGNMIPIENRSNILFAATTVTAGEARAVAFATGKSSFVVARHGGLIIRAGEGIPLIGKLKSWCGKVSLIFLAAAIVIAFVSLLFSDGTYNAATIFLSAISFAVASFSESFSAVACMIVASSMNSAAQEAVIKDGAMVEKIAESDCIVLSSSSLLRRGELTVVGYSGPDGTSDGKALPCGELDDLLELAYLSTGASAGTLQTGYVDDARTKIRSLCERQWSKEYRRRPATVIGYMSADEAQSAGLTNTLISRGGRNILLVSGSIARVLALCSSYLTKDGVKPFTETKRAEISAEADSYEKALSEVVAFATVETENINFSRIGAVRTKMTYSGFIAISDPITDGVSELIHDTRKAGFSYVLFTDGTQYDIKIAEKCGILTNRDKYIGARESADLRMLELAPGECAVIELPRGKSAQVKAAVAECLKNSDRNSVYLASEAEDAAAVVASASSMTVLERESLSHIPLALLTESDVIIHTSKESNGFFGGMRAVAYAKNVFANIKRVVSYMLTSQSAVAVLMISAAFFRRPLPNSVFLLFYGMIVGGLAMLSIAFKCPGEDTLTSGLHGLSHFMSWRRMIIPCGIGAVWGIVTVVSVAVSGALASQATVFSGATAMFVSMLLSSIVCAFECGAFPGKNDTSFRYIVSLLSFVFVALFAAILVRFLAPCAELIGGSLMSVSELIAALVPPVVLFALSEIGRRL